MKEFAAILLQLDAISGINSAVVIGEKTVKKNTPLQTDLNSYPNNANLYQSILKEIPKSVYEKPFVNIKDASKKITGVPKENFDFAREFGFIFTNMLNTYKNYIQNTNNVQLQFTYYPTLACDNGNGYTIRIKCEILQVPGHILLKDVFKISDNVNGNLRLTDNMEFYADFNTGQPVKDQQIPYNNVTIDQIVYIGQ